MRCRQKFVEALPKVSVREEQFGRNHTLVEEVAQYARAAVSLDMDKLSVVAVEIAGLNAPSAH